MRDGVTGTSFGAPVLEGEISSATVVTPPEGVGVSLGAAILGDPLDEVEFSLEATVFEVFFGEGELSSGVAVTPSGGVSLGAAVLGALLGEVGPSAKTGGVPLEGGLVRASPNASVAGDFGGEGGAAAGAGGASLGNWGADTLEATLSCAFLESIAEASLGDIDFGVFWEGEVKPGTAVATLGDKVAKASLGVAVVGAFLREGEISVGAMGALVGDGAAGAFGGDKDVTAGTLWSNRVAEVSLGTGVFLEEVGITSGTLGATLGGWITETSLEAVASVVFRGEGVISAGTFWGDVEVSTRAPSGKGGVTVEGTGAPLEDGETGESLSESLGL